MARPYNSLKSKACFFTFISFLACLTSTTVICFSMAILDDAFIYAGIACLIGVVLLVAGYTGCRYGCVDRFPSSEGDLSGEVPSRPGGDGDSFGGGRTDYRRLEREVEDLLGEVSELQATALCSAEALEREHEKIRTEYRQLTLWIEGSKVPEEGEVDALVRRIDDISVTLQNIRRRSERITSSLSRRPVTSVNLNLVIHDAIHPGIPLRPPPYDDSRRHDRNYSTRPYPPTFHPPFTVSYARSTPPSYGSMSHMSIAPPSDDLEAPPPYDEAIHVGTAV